MTHGVEDRWQDVDVARENRRDFAAIVRLKPDTTGASRSTTDLRKDQRDVERGLISEQAVGLLAVIAKPFAMVAGHDDERRVIRCAHIVEQRRESRVGRRDFAVIRSAGILRVERSRRAIRCVRVEQVHPHEPRLTSRPTHLRSRLFDASYGGQA